MGLFSRNTDNLPSSWIMLTDIDQLQGIKKASFDTPQVIYKDSTSCGISARAKSGLQEDWGQITDRAVFHYLDLLSYRSVSNEVANFSGVIHQSPQIIIYHMGEVIADTSHHAISVRYIRDVLDKI